METNIVDQIERQLQYIDEDDWDIRFENRFTEIGEFYNKAMAEPNANIWWLEHCQDFDIDDVWFDIFDYQKNIYPFLEYDDPIELANEWLTYNPENQEKYH
jgi:hypothetical protein